MKDIFKWFCIGIAFHGIVHGLAHLSVDAFFSVPPSESFISGVLFALGYYLNEM